MDDDGDDDVDLCNLLRTWRDDEDDCLMNAGMQSDVFADNVVSTAGATISDNPFASGGCLVENGAHTNPTAVDHPDAQQVGGAINNGLFIIPGHTVQTVHQNPGTQGVAGDPSLSLAPHTAAQSVHIQGAGNPALTLAPHTAAQFAPLATSVQGVVPGNPHIAAQFASHATSAQGAVPGNPAHSLTPDTATQSVHMLGAVPGNPAHSFAPHTAAHLGSHATSVHGVVSSNPAHSFAPHTATQSAPLVTSVHGVVSSNPAHSFAPHTVAHFASHATSLQGSVPGNHILPSAPHITAQPAQPAHGILPGNSELTLATSTAPPFASHATSLQGNPAPPGGNGSVQDLIGALLHAAAILYHTNRNVHK